MIKYRNIIFLIIFTVFIFLMNGCFTENTTNNKNFRSKIAFDYEKFKSEKEVWKLLNFKNYSYDTDNHFPKEVNYLYKFPENWRLMAILCFV